MECAGTDGGCRTCFVEGLSAPARRCGTSSPGDVADRGYGAWVRVNQGGRVPTEEYEAKRSRHHYHRIAPASEPQYVIAHVCIDTEMVSAVAFDTTIYRDIVVALDYRVRQGLAVSEERHWQPARG
jgi:hypothetical protein